MRSAEATAKAASARLRSHPPHDYTHVHVQDLTRSYTRDSTDAAGGDVYCTTTVDDAEYVVPVLKRLQYAMMHKFQTITLAKKWASALRHGLCGEF